MNTDLYNALRRCLANTFVFYYQAHAAHWNVVGDNFPQYHKFLDDLNGELFGAVDPLAEHIRTIQGFPQESLSEILSSATVSEFPMLVTDATALFTALLAANDTTIACLAEANALAEADGNAGLANFLQERLDTHAKHGWFLRATLGR